MKNTTKGRIIKGAAVCVDVAVPLVATLTQFPIWVSRSAEATMSGLFLLFSVLSCLPFLKQMKAYMKSPAVWSVWCILFVLFVLLRNIIEEMLIVCFFGMIANFAGAGIYKIGAIIGGKPDEAP